jgi:hypothetical protein
MDPVWIEEGKYIVYCTKVAFLYGLPKDVGLLEHQFDLQASILEEGLWPLCTDTHQGPNPICGVWAVPGC